LRTHSFRSDFTGSAKAARRDWKPTVNHAMLIAAAPAADKQF
jgi:hypothetical protein